MATPQTEERLLSFARNGTAAHVETLTRAWRRVDRNAENCKTEQRHRSRSLSLYQDEDGMFVIRGRLSPEIGALVRQAITAATDRLYAERRARTPGECMPTTTQVQADALAIVAEAALHHDLDPGSSGARYQVVVHVDAAVLADPDQPGQSVLEAGPYFSAEESRRVACDASRVLMKHDEEGRVIAVGARRRTIPPALRRAPQHRDHGCRFAGCGSRFTQGHHIRHWANGGPTTLANLALLCRRHHRAVHEDGFQLERLSNGELQFRSPHGWVLDEAPKPPNVSSDAAERLASENVNAGVQIDSQTLTPNWDGTRLNLDHAITVMHPRAVGH